MQMLDPKVILIIIFKFLLEGEGNYIKLPQKFRMLFDYLYF